jgi:hypothetical protein
VGRTRHAVDVTYMWGIDWLAGRGYNTFGVKFPAVVRANSETVHGTFLSVLLENLADPIISRREELGFSKLLREIPEPRVQDGKHSTRCGWLGHPFFDIEPSNLRGAPAAQPNPMNAGLLHYKFMLRTGDWGAAERPAYVGTGYGECSSALSQAPKIAWRLTP